MSVEFIESMPRSIIIIKKSHKPSSSSSGFKSNLKRSSLPGRSASKAMMAFSRAPEARRPFHHQDAIQKKQQQQQHERNEGHLARLSCNSSFRYKDILAARSVPILFILVCFLVIANTRCDQVGSANVEDTTTSEKTGHGGDKSSSSDLASLSSKDLEALENQANNIKKFHNPQGPASKLDPLNMLREIYLDQNSKIITMLMPESEQVQKFHPNGRYGRRSVDNFAESHAELGKMIYNEEQAQNRKNSGDGLALMNILRGIGRGSESGAVGAAHSRSAPSKYGGADGRSVPLNEVFASNGAQAANYQLEMNKLLKCNYTGISNLYWCDTTSRA